MRGGPRVAGAPEARSGPPGRRRLVGVAAGLVAASAYAGALGLATGTDPYLRHLTDRLPLRSPVLGGLALSAVVGVPYTVLAVDAWRGGPRTDRDAVLAGTLLIGWICTEVHVLGERSVLDWLYAGVGLLTVAAGRREVGKGVLRHAHDRR